LEAQLAGASIPEDDIELAGREVARLGGGDALGVDIIDEDNPVWGLMEYQGQESNIGRAQGKLVNRGKKFSVRLLAPSVDACLKIVGDGSSFCIFEACTTNHAGGGPPLTIDQSLVVILNQKDRAFTDLTLEGRLVQQKYWRDGRIQLDL
jgi:hypothetical protein